MTASIATSVGCGSGAGLGAAAGFGAAALGAAAGSAQTVAAPNSASKTTNIELFIKHFFLFSRNSEQSNFDFLDNIINFHKIVNVYYDKKMDKITFIYYNPLSINTLSIILLNSIF
jgi:hypothetical protein